MAQWIKGLQYLNQPLPPSVVTIGNFDGVHLGHLKLLEVTRHKAAEFGAASVVFTFKPHPQAILRPDAAPSLLLTYSEKVEQLSSRGVDVVVEEPFSRQFSEFTAEEFFARVLVRQLSARAVVVGYDFAFGRERRGSLESLRAFCSRSGVELTVVPPFRLGDEVVSSSRIREHFAAGRVEEGNALLGHPFFYRGHVIRGEGRGRKIGFPTANLQLDQKLVLPYGVYATEAWLGGVSHLSVTNLGVRPTFAGGSELPALVETHLLHQSLDLYGQVLEVRFVKKLRDERKFSGIDALKAQIALDAAQAEGVLADWRRKR